MVELVGNAFSCEIAVVERMADWWDWICRNSGRICVLFLSVHRARTGFGNQYVGNERYLPAPGIYLSDGNFYEIYGKVTARGLFDGTIGGDL